MAYLFFDTVIFDAQPRITRDGYLVADARTARTGIQTYAGIEVGRPQMAQVRVYRPEEEVFSKDALASMAHRPVTNGHPVQDVNAANWKALSVGMTGGEVARDGEYVRIPLTLMDKAAIDDWRGGRRELSWGYECELDWTPGKTRDGQSYDAVQRGISANHLAFVDKARAGSECRIGDRNTPPAKPEEKQMADRKITVDGFTIEVSDQAAQAIEKLLAKVADGEKAAGVALATLEARDGEIAALKKTHSDAVAAKDAQIAAFDAAIEAKIEERQAVIADAAKITGKTVDGKGKSTAAIRREAVVLALGDAVVKDKSDDFVASSFATLLAVADKKPDALAAAISGSLPFKAADGSDPQAARDAAYDNYVARLNGVAKKEA
jgi:hypothetical protein